MKNSNNYKFQYFMQSNLFKFKTWITSPAYNMFAQRAAEAGCGSDVVWGDGVVLMIALFCYIPL